MAQIKDPADACRRVADRLLSVAHHGEREWITLDLGGNNFLVVFDGLPREAEAKIDQYRGDLAKALEAHLASNPKG